MSEEPKIISREELKKKIVAREKIVLVDVLSKESFERVHIPNSVNIPLDELEERAEKELNKKGEVIVYCASFECHASEHAYKILKRKGFGNLFEYAGGIKDWMNAGHEIKTRLGKKK